MHAKAIARIEAARQQEGDPAPVLTPFENLKAGLTAQIDEAINSGELSEDENSLMVRLRSRLEINNF